MPERYNIAADVCDKHPRDKLGDGLGALRRRDARGRLGRAPGPRQPGRQRARRRTGSSKGDRVAVVLPPTPETAAIFFGTWKLGAILLSMSVLYGDDGIRHRLEDSEPKVLVTDAANAAALRRVAGRRDPRARRTTCSPARPTDSDLRRHLGRRPRPALLHVGHHRAWRRASSTPTATSSPTRSSSTATTSRTASASTAWASGPGRPGISPLLGPWRLGAVQCVYQREGGFDPARAARLPLPPRGHERLHDADRDAGDDGDRRRGRALPAAVPRSSARPASRSTPRRSAGSASSTGVTVLDYYGLTESYPLCANFPFMEVREGSMGRPMPGWDVQILDEDENPVAQGERGEICLRARSNPHYPLGYWRNDGGRRGDLRRRVVPLQGRRDAGRGRLRLVRRPRRRRDHRRRLPDRPVRGRVRLPRARRRRARPPRSPRPTRSRATSSRRSSSSPRATSPPTSSPTRSRRFVRERLSAYAYPRRIEFVDELPKTLTGKIRRIELRERGARGASA